jgi:hypothetical protein
MQDRTRKDCAGQIGSCQIPAFEIGAAEVAAEARPAFAGDEILGRTCRDSAAAKHKEQDGKGKCSPHSVPLCRDLAA